ncbi:uncharacterized protein LOC113052410 [Carassius auratus]|uniref:Uncharacterized protein LOC113052410 n=1 Tax=Carassius auratus TaxID=7957 RepID=A0A6P6KK34_CARAU|nr:uncharacterized protein LOC113052410 [Carassius auratus]
MQNPGWPSVTCLCGFHSHRDEETDPAPPAADSDSTHDPGPGPVQFWLPDEMRETIPSEDQRWIATELFHGDKLRPQVNMWYDPPVPAQTSVQAPSPEHFLSHSLLVWMPNHLWKAELLCPVCGKQLLHHSVHKRVRKVLDIDRYYLMMTETLRCTSCQLNYLSSSQTVLNQLDLPRRQLFRLVLTERYACDMRVVRMLRDRTLSFTRLAEQLRNIHGGEWLDHLSLYMGECADFVSRPRLFPAACPEPPEPSDIPNSQWLLSVYGRDIVSRLEHMKASITSTFGSILKLHSSVQIARKLSGRAEGGKHWLYSVTNETGQVLISVLTAQEGPGLDSMASGLMNRYRQAATAPPVLMYMDSGCCSENGHKSEMQARFGGWPDLHIRLDVWSFMLRLAAGCTSDTHPLYSAFIARLSVCIFQWDPLDIALLRQTKREHLEQEGVPFITNDLVDSQITARELVLHCRRRTRGVETTVRYVEQLLQELKNWRDPFGVPLLDAVKMENIWHDQKKHVPCIQDVPGVILYTETGTSVTRTGLILTKYRCARGLTDLQSFHRHLNSFIPGAGANSLNFQLYLLDGLYKWNQEQLATSIGTKPSSVLSYAGEIVEYVNDNYLQLFGRKLVRTFPPPKQYTGELIGVDYLLRQMGQPPQTVDPDTEETIQLLEDVNDEGQEDGGFDEDVSIDPTVSLFLEDPPAFPSTSSTAEDAPVQIPETVKNENPSGLDEVDRLADYLVDLRTENHLSSTQVSDIVQLWHNMSELKKQQRSSTSSPQQRCPLVDAILLRLCEIYRGPDEEETVWSLVLQDYCKIRQLILADANLQLLDMSKSRLMQWRNQTHAAAGEQAPPKRPPVDIAKFPAVRPKLAAQMQPVVQLLPGKPLGTFGPRSASTLTVVAIPQRLVPLPPATLLFIPSTPHIVPALSRPGSQRPVARRTCNRKVEANTCKKCGSFRTAATGHSQFRGTVFCPATETLSKEQWLEKMRRK